MTTIAVDKHNLFKVAPPKSSAKGDITADAARAIIRSHAEHQYAKTERLLEVLSVVLFGISLCLAGGILALIYFCDRP